MGFIDSDKFCDVGSNSPKVVQQSSIEEQDLETYI